MCRRIEILRYESRVYSIGQTPNFESHLHVIETKCVTEFEDVNVSGEENSLAKACAYISEETRCTRTLIHHRTDSKLESHLRVIKRKCMTGFDHGIW